MKRSVLFILIAVVTVFIQGCYYDVEEELYPANDCDTTNVTYSLTIKPIIDDNCLFCHSQASQQGGVVLETHDDLLGYANSGQLVGSVTHDPDYAAMPQGAAKLSDCNILKIDKWVRTGSPNN
jgi:Planctomycete cytochrome C